MQCQGWRGGWIRQYGISEKRFQLGFGRLFALYVAAYTVGRVWVEALRVDHANHILADRLGVRRRSSRSELVVSVRDAANCAKLHVVSTLLPFGQHTSA